MLLGRNLSSLLLAGSLLGACGAPPPEVAEVSSSQTALSQADGTTSLSECDIRQEDRRDCRWAYMCTDYVANCRAQPCTSSSVKTTLRTSDYRVYDRRVRAQYYSGSDWWRHNLDDDCWVWENLFATDCI